MAYTDTNYKSKKALIEDIKLGRDVRCHQPGLGPDLSTYTGRIALEGPHYPKPHTWYAEATLLDGRVISVK